MGFFKNTKEISGEEIKWAFLILCIGLLFYTNLRNSLFTNERIFSFTLMGIIVILLTIFYYLLIKHRSKILEPKNK